MVKNKSISCLGALLLCLSISVGAEQKITVFAAASLTNAVTEIAAEYEKNNAVKIQTSFA